MCFYTPSMNEFKEWFRDSQMSGRSDKRPICFYRHSLMTLNNDAETARCKEYRIRIWVSISGLLFCIKLLWMTLKNDEEIAKM